MSPFGGNDPAAPAVARLPGGEREAVQLLLRRIWAGICRYKGMVTAMLIFGVLEAAFTKLPLVIVKPLLAEMGATPVDPTAPAPADLPGGDAFIQWFRGFSIDLCALFGLSFDHVGMAVVAAGAIVSIACGVVGALAIYQVQTISRFFAHRIVADLRCELAQHFLNLPLRFFGRQRMGEMMSKVTNDTQAIQRSFEMATDNIIVDPLMIVGNMMILAWFVPQAIVVLLVMMPMMAIPIYRQGLRVQRRSTKSLVAMGETTESLSQILTGIRTVKAFQLEGIRQQQFERSTAVFLDRTRRMLRAKGRSIAQTFLGYQIGFAVLLVLFGYVVLVERAVAFHDVGVILAPLATTYQHVKRATRAYHVLMESSGALAGIEPILRTPVDATMIGGQPLAAVRGDVVLDDVWFAYDEQPVLRGVSLAVRAGQSVALVGPSGGGKSTTIDLLLRFHDPQRGRILIDGIDLRDIRLADYRQHTAVVSQQPFLFNTSIRENIACGRIGASQAEIEAAARAANIHDFIVSLPAGYDTPAGERGGNLSGGQMQRITIARAILRDPAILLLDEATSALDSENEELVQRALDNLRRGRTSFVIAHRLSTIVAADLIVVLDQGRVVELGTHEQLLANSGSYRRMYDLQTT